MSRTEACSPESIADAFRSSGFVSTGAVATTLYLAESLGKPLLVEGPPGVGKTEIGKLWALFHEAQLVRLQCYEGLDEAKALYEWSYGKQMLYAQLLREKTADLLRDAQDLNSAIEQLRGQTDEFFSRDFLLPRPLLAAIASDDPVVLLVDEVDRADEEFEALLLEVLSEGQVSIPELGTIKAARPPRVILTSNDSRELSDALRRRCLYLYVDYPDFQEELQIVESRVSGISERLCERLVRFAQKVRRTNLRKQPGVAEVIDWALALTSVGAEDLTNAALKRTLGALIKNRDDMRDVLQELGKLRS